MRKVRGPRSSSAREHALSLAASRDAVALATVALVFGLASLEAGY